MKRQQREQLFDSPELRRAQIRDFRRIGYTLEMRQLQLESEVRMIRERREELRRRIQELQNLELEL